MEKSVSYSYLSHRHMYPLSPFPSFEASPSKKKEMSNSPGTSSQNLMPSRLRKQAQYRAEDQRRHEQDTHTQHVGPVRIERHRDMVQQPDGDNEQEEDDGCDDQGHEGVDAPAREVADFGVVRFRCGFLTSENGSIRSNWEEM